MTSAARAGGMSDSQLRRALHDIKAGETLSDFQRAVLDEAEIRGMLRSSESRISISPSHAHF